MAPWITFLVFLLIILSLMFKSRASYRRLEVENHTITADALREMMSSGAKLLVARKADATVKDKRGFDSFYLAHQLEDPEILELLMHRAKSN